MVVLLLFFFFVELLYISHACHLHSRSHFQSDNPAIIAAQNNATRRCVPSSTKKLAIDNVRVFNGHKLLPPSTVIIDGPLISDDPTDAEHFDGSSLTLLPGLIDSHIHPTNIKHLQDLTKWGVTTGVMMACFSTQQCTSLQNHTGLIDVFRTSAPAAAPGSVHGNITAMVDQSGTLLVYNASDAKRWVEQQVKNDPDYVKIVAETPGLSQSELDFLVSESHRLGKEVVCHASVRSAYDQAAHARVDQIHHAPLDEPISTDLAKQILTRGQIVTPTLSIMQAISKANPLNNFNASVQSVSLLHKMGVPILAGTDANLQPGIPAFVPFGTSLHLELELLVQAGLSNVDALRAATSHAAKLWNFKDRGVIRKGMRADLLLVEGDPTKDIRATRNIKKVWANGVEVSGIGK
ncbi:putative hydrolase [Zopfia rhizophila CBS 207.26]|uniref:Putative hydrolase n=1 Tax=Zopfia rhizophila CBS 207.26 TaxID=1314779 RepID=A0A6A6DLW2_9PEZI|nr:putative hydrolase [Zopfia rhizophila CBS 207.26]